MRIVQKYNKAWTKTILMSMHFNTFVRQNKVLCKKWIFLIEFHLTISCKDWTIYIKGTTLSIVWFFKYGLLTWENGMMQDIYWMIGTYLLHLSSHYSLFRTIQVFLSNIFATMKYMCEVTKLVKHISQYVEWRSSSHFSDVHVHIGRCDWLPVPYNIYEVHSVRPSNVTWLQIQN